MAQVPSDWYADEAFWAEMSVGMFHPGHLAATPAEVDGVLRILDPAPGARVLDMPCGFGRHSRALARRGFRVTGVDLSEGYLERAAAAAGGGEVIWERADMRRFRRPGGFDVALNLYSSFGYFEDADDDHLVLANLFASLRPGGQLLMDLTGKEVLARTIQDRSFHEVGDVIILERARILDAWSRCETRWTVLRGDEQRERAFTTRLYSAAVLSGALFRAGFRQLRVFGDLSRPAPYDHRARRLVIAARRPAGADPHKS